MNNNLINIENNYYALSIVIIYFLSLLYIGFKGLKNTKTFSDYIIGDRKLGPIVGALNVGASDMSSWLLMGLPGAFYLLGLNQIWMLIGLILGSFASWNFIAKRLRKFTEIRGNSLTISQFLENRFDDKSKILTIVTSIIIIFFFTIYISSGFVGGAKLFSQFLGVSYQLALIISCIAIVLYALIGGFLAISWADLFQGLLMLFVLIITPSFVIYHLDISAIDLIGKIKEISPSHLNPFYELDFFAIIGFLSWGLGYFGQPHIISKYMAIKNPEEIRVAKVICLSWMSLSMFGAAIVGMLGVVYFAQNPLKEAETVFISITTEMFHPIFIGIFIAAILAAIMSTINAQIIICCSALSQDFYKRFLRKNANDKEMLVVTRLFVIVVAIISALIAQDENSSVLALVARAWAGLGASIGPIILFSLFWKKTTRSGAIAGIISGAVSAIICSKISFFSYEMLPAFLISSIAIFITSLATKNQIPNFVEDDFKLMLKK